MVQRSPDEWNEVACAVVVWTGWGRFAWPRREDERVATAFGQYAAARLLPMIHDVVATFYSTDAHLRAADLVEMGDLASAEFRSVEPDAPEDIVRVLAWCFTFDNR